METNTMMEITSTIIKTSTKEETTLIKKKTSKKETDLFKYLFILANF
jgi:hypothetical protein